MIDRASPPCVQLPQWTMGLDIRGVELVVVIKIEQIPGRLRELDEELRHVRRYFFADGEVTRDVVPRGVAGTEHGVDLAECALAVGLEVGGRSRIALDFLE